MAWVKELESADLPPNRTARLGRALADVSLVIMRATIRRTVLGSDDIYLRCQFFGTLQAFAALRKHESDYWSSEKCAAAVIAGYSENYEPARESRLRKHVKEIAEAVEIFQQFEKVLPQTYTRACGKR